MSPADFSTCAGHLAREFHAQRSRLGARTGALAPYEWESLSQENRDLDITTFRSLLYRGIIACPRGDHRTTASLRDGSASETTRFRSTKPCPNCGTWTCSSCGWSRKNTTLARPEEQHCHRCGGTKGDSVPTRHSKRLWILCNAIPAEFAHDAWRNAPA